MRNILKECAMAFLLFLFLPPMAMGALAEKTEEVVFYPTDVADAGDFAYLRDSVRMMLASRIASAAGGEVRLENKMIKGRDFNSYRVLSRIAYAGNGIELSVKAFRPSEETSLQFQSTAKNSADIMTALDGLVADVAQSLFEKQDVKEEVTIPEKTIVEDVALSSSHPDRIYKTTSGFGLSISQDEFISQTALEVNATDRYKSAVIPAQSKGMTAGDIDGDSLQEILIATNTRLYIYQLKDKEIQHLDTVSLPGELKVHALNVADLDANGVMEIYISSTRRGLPRSFIIEWHPATGVKWLYENVYWYLRPVVIPGEGVVLAGQQSGIEGGMSSGIFRLVAHVGEEITGGERLVLPESTNLFDFVFADLEGDKLSEVVVLNKKEQLQVYSSDSKLIYTSPAGFGGRELLEDYTAPIRLVVSDFDGDGHDDILLVDNELYSPKMMNKTRLYRNGQVRGLAWDGGGFMEVWHTNIFPNSIVDFQFFSIVETKSVVRGSLFIVEPEKADLLQSLLLGLGGNRLSVYGMDFISKAGQGKE
ncbi:MAG: VCBS repeat-containing protein [Desulfocapsa sp.]|nr:VCBS repeat-containing protein [Desulfocapsa sp.]